MSLDFAGTNVMRGRSNMPRYLRLLMLVVVMAMVAAACSSDAEEATPTTGSGGEEPTEPTEATGSTEATEPTQTTNEPATPTQGDTCPSSTSASPSGVTAGAFPGQFESAEYEAAAGCELQFSGNPNAETLASEIAHIDGSLPAVADRLPAEPLVMQPLEAIGSYGGTFNGLSRANEAGTADLLSVRHVNLVRFASDLVTIVPNVAKSWEYNDDFTELTFELREGHRWSDGSPFTSEDVRFWLEDLHLNTDVVPVEGRRSQIMFGGEPIAIEVLDETTFTFKFAVPAPGFLSALASSFWQPFQPKAWFDKYFLNSNPDADELATSLGFDDWVDAVTALWGPSDWKDVASPFLTGRGGDWAPTLESYIVVDETSEDRRMVANPYFYAVDTTGQQLPYIDAIEETFIGDEEVQLLRVTAGETDYKSQGLTLAAFPVLDSNEESGGYTTQLAPSVGSNVFYAFNLAIADPTLNALFNEYDFRRAMSVAINRSEINELVWFGQGVPQQVTPIDPNTVGFITDDQLNEAIEFDPAQANGLLDGLGLVAGSDGCRSLPDGSDFTLLLRFSDQFGRPEMHELVQGYWEDIGICANLTEVTSDEYRDSAARNELQVLTQASSGTASAVVIGNDEQLIPPWGEFFSPGPALHWAAFVRGIDNGVDPVDPPAEVKELIALVEQWQQLATGTDESDAIGNELVQVYVDNLWKIGTIGSVPGPVVHRDALVNVPDFTATTFDFYFAYPYGTYTWFLAE